MPNNIPGALSDYNVVKPKTTKPTTTTGKTAKGNSATTTTKPTTTGSTKWGGAAAEKVRKRKEEEEKKRLAAEKKRLAEKNKYKDLNGVTDISKLPNNPKTINQQEVIAGSLSHLPPDLKAANIARTLADNPDLPVTAREARMANVAAKNTPRKDSITPALRKRLVERHGEKWVNEKYGPATGEKVAGGLAHLSPEEKEKYKRLELQDAELELEGANAKNAALLDAIDPQNIGSRAVDTLKGMGKSAIKGAADFIYGEDDELLEGEEATEGAGGAKGAEGAGGAEGTTELVGPEQPTDPTDDILYGYRPQPQVVEEDPADGVPVNPKSLYGDTTRQYLATAAPATEEDKGLFQNPSFQKTALVFGLDLLFGSGNIRDAAQNAAGAYRVEAYKETGEYKKYRQMGVPEGVIRQALATDDWAEMRQWVSIKQAAADRQAAATAKLAADAGNMTDGEKKAYETLLGQYEKTAADISGASAIIDQLANYEGREINGIEAVSLMYDYISSLDPASTVRDSEIQLLLSVVPLQDEWRLKAEKALASGEAIPAIPQNLIPLIIDNMKKRSMTRVQTGLKSYERLNRRSDVRGLGEKDRIWNADIDMYTKKYDWI